jgi:glycosyltransferase involved in cell wall biosynthesis
MLRGMRVAFVLHSAKRDGAGKAFLELIDGLRGTEVQAMVLLPKTGPLAEDIKARGVRVVIVPYRWWMDRGTPAWKKAVRTIWNLLMALPVAVVLRLWKCEVVYTNTLTISAGGFAARILRLPHVWHVHELFGGETGFAFDLGEKLSLRLLNSLADACITVSEAAKTQLLPYMPPERIRTVYQSVSVPAKVAETLDRRAVRPEGMLVCAIVGSIFPLKRQEDAVRAIAILRRQEVRVGLSLIGEGNEEYLNRLVDLVALEQLGNQTRFFGLLVDPFPVLGAADVLLACSPVEACSRAIVEGMLLGKPAIAARGGGNSELVQDGFNGLLYESGDCNDLARCIRFLAENSGERTRLGANARGWAESRFSGPEYGQAVLGILQSAAVRKA